MICNNTSKGILNTLPFVLIETGQTSKQKVTVVQMTTNQGICSNDCHFCSKILSYSTKVTHLKKARFASPFDMFREGKFCIKPHTLISDRINWMKKATTNTDREVGENLLTLSLRTKDRIQFFLG